MLDIILELLNWSSFKLSFLLTLLSFMISFNESVLYFMLDKLFSVLNFDSSFYSSFWIYFSLILYFSDNPILLAHELMILRFLLIFLSKLLNAIFWTKIGAYSSYFSFLILSDLQLPTYDMLNFFDNDFVEFKRLFFEIHPIEFDKCNAFVDGII